MVRATASQPAQQNSRAAPSTGATWRPGSSTGSAQWKQTAADGSPAAGGSRKRYATLTRRADLAAFLGSVRLSTPSLYSALAPWVSTSSGRLMLRETMP
jgi:hypothetical protein